MSIELINKFETKIKAIEAEIAQTLSRHAGLLGLLQGTREALMEAQQLAMAVPLVVNPNVIDEALKVENVIEEAVKVAKNVSDNKPKNTKK